MLHQHQQQQQQQQQTVQLAEWELSGESFLMRLEELAWNRDWEAIHTTLDHVLQIQHALTWALHPAAFCGLVELIFYAPAPPVDLVQRIYHQLSGKYAFVTESHTSQAYPLHALVSSSSRHLSVVNIVQFLATVAPETAHLKTRNQRPIDVVTHRLLNLQKIMSEGSLSQAPPRALLQRYESNNYYDTELLSHRQILDDDEFLWTCAYHLVRMMMMTTTTTSSSLGEAGPGAAPFATATSGSSPAVDMVRCCIQARHVLPRQLMELALERYYEQLSEPDAEGNLPLHLLVSSPEQQQDAALLSAILQGYPYAACIPNAANQLPLQLAVQAGRRWKDLPELVDASPQGVLSLFPDNKKTNQDKNQEENKNQQGEEPSSSSEVVDCLLLTKLSAEQRSPGSVFLLLQRNPHWMNPSEEDSGS